MTTTPERRRLASEAVMTMASSLADKLVALGQPATSGLIEQALHELLDGQDQAAKALRAAFQIHLAIVSNGGSATAADVKTEDMLSTEQAARLMECSRPYVAMLIDAEKLAGGVTSKGGHRKVPKSSVLRWIETTNAAKEASAGDSDYRKAAADAGMYAIPDEAYAKTAKPRGQRAD